MKILEFDFCGKKFQFYQTPTAPSLVNEIFGDNYHVLRSGVEFADGDTILDLGANEGMFSIMMARLFPQVRVISVEPVLRTYSQLVQNIMLNKVDNIIPYNFGVGKREDWVEIVVCKVYSGGSSALINFIPESHTIEWIKTVPLDDIFKDNIHSRCRLLKIDIEGMEHEVLRSAKCLDRVDFLVGEFHINKKLEDKEYSIRCLVDYIKSKTCLLYCECIKMAE